MKTFREFILDAGDSIIRDRGQLGFDVLHKDHGKKLYFLNQAGELALRDKLNKKYPDGRKSPNVLLGLRKKI